MSEQWGVRERGERNTKDDKLIPKPAICIVISLLVIGLGFSIFILALVHNPFFFIFYLFLSSFLLSFIVWNSLSCRHHIAFSLFLRSFPLSHLHIAPHAHLVKISGPVSCGDVSLVSPYEKVDRCVYTSTVLYESRGVEFKSFNFKVPCFPWKLAYIERFSTDFYITDIKSGIRTLVKAGYGSKVISLISESRLVSTSRNRILSPNLTKWLKERNLSAESGPICLKEGYIQEGNCVTVIGMLHKGGDDNTPMVVQPPELISTGCLWQRLLLPVDFDGLILGLTNVTDSTDRGQL